MHDIHKYIYSRTCFVFIWLPFWYLVPFLYVISPTGRKLVIIISEMVLYYISHINLENFTSQLMRSKKDLITISFLILLIQVGNHCSMSVKELVTLPTIREHSRFCCGVCVAVVFGFIALFVFVLCLVCPMLSVCLDCPFPIAPTVSQTFIWYGKYILK